MSSSVTMAHSAGNSDAGPKHPLVEAELPGLGLSLPLLIVSLALLLLVSVLCFFTWNAYVRSADQTRVSVAILAGLKNVVTWLQEAETSQRGFLLTGDPAYLDESRRALPQVAAQLASIEAQNRRRTKVLIDLDSFEEAAERKSYDLEKTLGLIRDRKLAEAIAEVRTARGRTLMNTVREKERQLEGEEQGRLGSVRTRSRFYARLSQLVATFGSAGIFAIVLISTIRIRQLNATRAILTAQLKRTNEDLKQFVYSASHDLQEPLRNLMLYSELVERRIANGSLEAVGEDTRSIRLFADRMRALVFDLLAYTQVATSESAAREEANLNDVAAREIENCRESAPGADLQITCDPLPTLPIAEVHAEQLIRQLLTNAVKYRRQGVPARIRISARRGRSEWIISVKDNGIGIDPSYHAHIFGIFKRLHTATEYPGTGLGLAICRKIVERHQGRIWVESQLDVGSTFHFAIPAAPAAKAARRRVVRLAGTA